MFAGVIFLLSFFQLESPRFLIKKGKVEEATKTMAVLRNMSMDSDYVVREIHAIRVSYEEELEATKGATWVGILKEMVLIPSNLYRLYLTSCVQFLSQWSGAGSITLYAPDLFHLLGEPRAQTNRRCCGEVPLALALVLTCLVFQAFRARANRCSSRPCLAS